MKDLTGNLKKLLSQKEIKDCVEAMGEKISAQYSNSNPIFIGVLNGSFIFMADLLRSVTIDCEVDFIKVRSYLGKKSSGTIKLLKDKELEKDLEIQKLRKENKVLRQEREILKKATIYKDQTNAKNKSFYPGVKMGKD